MPNNASQPNAFTDGGEAYGRLLRSFKDGDLDVSQRLMRDYTPGQESREFTLLSNAGADTLLRIAISRGDTEQLDLLLARGRAYKSMSGLECSEKLLCETIKAGGPRVVAYKAFRLGQRLDAVDLDQKTPLGHAISNGDGKAFLFLIERGADPKDIAFGKKTGVDMILEAQSPGAQEIAALLKLPLDTMREQFAERQVRQEEELLDALERRDIIGAREAFEAGAFIRWGSAEGFKMSGLGKAEFPTLRARKVLMDALHRGRAEIVRLMFLETPMTRAELMGAAIACKSPSKDIYDWASGPIGSTVWSQAFKGVPLLHRACRAGNLAAVEAMLGSGANPHGLIHKGRTAAELADSMGFGAIVDLIAERCRAPSTSKEDMEAVENLGGLFNGLEDDGDQASELDAPIEPMHLQCVASVLVFPCESVKTLQSRSAGDADRRKVADRAVSLMKRDNGYRDCLGAPRADRILALAERFPTFSEVIEDIASRASITLRAQGRAGQPRGFKVPNLLFVGPPGMGKTAFSRELAKACSLDFHEVQMGPANSFSLAGLDAGYSTGRPGQIFEALANGAHANPIILLDEIDKAGDAQREHSAMAPLFSLLERGSSTRWKDTFTEAPMDASHINFIASANAVDGIDSAILSRFSVYEIPTPSAEQSKAIARSVYREVLEREAWSDLFDPTLPESTLSRLAGMSPRDAIAELSRALPRASLAGRDHPLEEDFKKAKAATRPIGF